MKIPQDAMIELLLVFDVCPILGDPGAVSGGREKSKRARKNFGRRKVKKESKSPRGQGFNGPVPNDRKSSGFSLVPEKLFIYFFIFFSAQSQSSNTGSRFLFSYTKYTYLPVARHKLTEGFLEEKSSKHSTKCRGNPQETRWKYAGPFAGITVLAYLKDHEFVYTQTLFDKFFGVCRVSEFLGQNAFSLFQ